MYGAPSLHSSVASIFFFFNDTATTEIYTLSLHDALPIARVAPRSRASLDRPAVAPRPPRIARAHRARPRACRPPEGHRSRGRHINRRVRDDHGRTRHRQIASYAGAAKVRNLSRLSVARGAVPLLRRRHSLLAIRRSRA